jgi:hypothetical protein
MPNVSTLSPSVTPKDVTGLLNDHTKHLTNHLHYLVENRLVKIFKTLNPSANSGSVLGTPQAPSSLAQHEALENPLYGMPKNFTPSQAPPVMRTLPLRPKTAMVISPPILEPLNSIPSSAAMSQTNELASFVPPYQTIAYSTPPILPRGTRIPCGLVPDYYFNNKYGAPDRVPKTEPRGASINSFEECLDVVREDLKKQMRETFGVELSSKSRIYKKLYPSHFDLVPYPMGWRTPNFVKFSREDNRTTWEHVSQYLARLGEVGSIDALKIHLFSLSLTGIAFSSFSSLSSNSVDSWKQLKHKFHDHFYSPENELKFSDLASVRQGCDESVSDYIRRFRDTKNGCFNLMITRGIRLIWLLMVCVLIFEKS